MRQGPLLLLLLSLGCGPPSITEVPAQMTPKATEAEAPPVRFSVEEFQALRKLSLSWLDETRLSVAPGVVFNVENGCLFFARDNRIQCLEIDEDVPKQCVNAPAECAAAKDHAPAVSSRGSAMAWTQQSIQKAPELCIFQPPRCEGELEALVFCHLLDEINVDFPAQHSESTKSDPLFAALVEANTLYLRGKSEGNSTSALCSEWRVESRRTSNRIQLSWTLIEEGIYVTLGQTIHFNEEKRFSTTSHSSSTWEPENFPPEQGQPPGPCPLPGASRSWKTSSSISGALEEMGKITESNGLFLETETQRFYWTRTACEEAAPLAAP